jgi:hypothetical protein
MGLFKKQGVYWIDYSLQGCHEHERIDPGKRLDEMVPLGDKMVTYASKGKNNTACRTRAGYQHLGVQQTPPKVLQKPYIPMLQEQNVRKGFFEHDEFVALRAALPVEVRPVATFGYFTGGASGKSWTSRGIASTYRLGLSA